MVNDDNFFFSAIDLVMLGVEYDTLLFKYIEETLENGLTANTVWSVVSKPAWVIVWLTSGNGGATLTITVERNESTESRSGEIVIRSLHKEVSISVQQNGKPTSLIISDPGMMFIGEGEEKSNYLTARVSWSVTSKPDWVNVTPSSGASSATLIVTALMNNSGEYRYGVVEITGSDGQKEYIMIEQANTGMQS